MFSPPSGFGPFDVVGSFGLLEHFSDTRAAVAAVSRFVRPGGLLISMIPNMTGGPGRVQRWIGREIFEMHVPLSLRELGEAHRDAGLSVVALHPMMTFNPYVLQAGAGSRSLGLVTRVASGLLGRFVWKLESASGISRETTWFSPYYFCASVVQ
jgi:SAM-dependent methyltransferase